MVQTKGWNGYIRMSFNTIFGLNFLDIQSLFPFECKMPTFIADDLWKSFSTVCFKFLKVWPGIIWRRVGHCERCFWIEIKTTIISLNTLVSASVHCFCARSQCQFYDKTRLKENFINAKLKHVRTNDEYWDSYVAMIVNYKVEIEQVEAMESKHGCHTQSN